MTALPARLQILLHPGKHPIGIVPVKIHVITLAHTEFRESVVPRRGDAMPLEALPCALQMATIEGDDRSARTCSTYQRLDVTPDSCDAGHFRELSTVEPYRHVIGELGCTRATRTGINQRKVAISAVFHQEKKGHVVPGPTCPCGGCGYFSLAVLGPPVGASIGMPSSSTRPDELATQRALITSSRDRRALRSMV